MNLQLLLLSCFVPFCCASLSGFSSYFKGKNNLRDSILSGDKRNIMDILRWKSCDILLANENSLLQLLLVTNQRNLLNEIFASFNEKMESCLVKGIQTALKSDENDSLDALLTVTKDLCDNTSIGKVFKKCVNARNYRCIGIMTDWHVPLSYEGRNILHFAAEMDDFSLFKYAPKDEILLDKPDDNGQYAMAYVLSRGMAKNLSAKWVVETQKLSPRSWDCVQSMYNMTTLFEITDNTLPFRASLLAHRLQRSAESSHSPAFILSVSRNSVFKDSYTAIHKNNVAKFNWYRDNLKLEIRFDSEMGIDVGGPRLEWLSLMVDAMIKENPDGNELDFTAPLFKEIDGESGMYAPTMKYNESVYEFAGSILALAFREKISLKVNLIPAAIKMILHNVYKYNPDDLKLQHPQNYKSLQNLAKLSDEDIQKFELFFESDPAEPVNKSNFEKYMKDYGYFHTFTKYEPALKALAKGFNKINRVHLLHSLFNHKEMTDILRGGNTIDLESFKKHSNVSGSEESRQIFWKMMEMLTEEEKLNFLKFITGRDSVPFEGITGLKDKLNISLNVLKSGLLPTASTCSSTINFAVDIRTPEEMKRRLLLSMENGTDFGLA